jgi:hypothetical protein
MTAAPTHRIQPDSCGRLDAALQDAFRTRHPVEHPCPGDLAIEIARYPYITLEVEMPRTAAEFTPTAKIEFASYHLDDSDPDCLNGDPWSLTQATGASQAKPRTGRRRLVDPTTCERDYAPAELEFMQAMQKYKQWSGRMFPTWSEVLEVLQGLGYEKAIGGRAVPGAWSAPYEEVTS